MTKSWSLVCFLVLAASVFCSGNNETSVRTEDEAANSSTEPPESHTQTPTPAPALTPAPEESDTNLEEANGHLNTSATNETSETPATTETETTEDDWNENSNVSRHQTMPAVVTTTRGRGRHLNVSVTTAVSMTTAGASKAPAAGGAGGGGGSPSWAYVLLVLIILVIVILCFILYLLRRASRTYSFDLQRPAPVHRLDEPIGTFEPVYLDDLDPPAPKDHVPTEDPPPPPTVNGTTPPSGEKTSNGEIVNQDPPEVNEKPLTSATCPSQSDDPAADKTSGTPSDSSLFFDAPGLDEQQNENNNNPSVCSSDPFVEINLDDPAWCDQLLNSAAAPSSVLPFTPFSFSPQSSSS